MKPMNKKIILVVILPLLLACSRLWAAMPPIPKDTGNTLNAMGQQQEDQLDLRIRLALEIAQLYGLTRSQAIVLLAIYEHEDGGPGKEFGIEWPPCPYDDGKRSFLDNCRRCCETILNHCPNSSVRSIKAMNYGNGRWPGYASDRDWWKGVRRGVRKYQNILYD